MKRSGILRRLAGFVVAAALVLSLATPARAQFDPMTLSLLMGGFQLLSGALSMITVGSIAGNSDTKTGIALPYGTPCGMVDGVPQICWQPHAGGFEGSPDLPTGAPKAVPAPVITAGESASAAQSPSQGEVQSQ